MELSLEKTLDTEQYDPAKITLNSDGLEIRQRGFGVSLTHQQASLLVSHIATFQQMRLAIQAVATQE